ncbi:MAG: chromate transporter [Acidobacteriota bacterium]|nr:chromate transporter [Acidobacteriota bacterium]
MPGLLQLASLFLRVGNTTVGGGDPTIAALQRELTGRGWLDRDQFAIAYGLSRLTPGTNMLAFCAAAGWYVLGTAGALAGVLAVTIPSSVLVVWLTGICELSNRLPWLHAMIEATIAAALGIMLAAVLSLVRGQISKEDWMQPALVAASAFALRQLGLSPVVVIGLAALCGILAGTGAKHSSG